MKFVSLLYIGSVVAFDISQEGGQQQTSAYQMLSQNPNFSTFTKFVSEQEFQKVIEKGKSGMQPQMPTPSPPPSCPKSSQDQQQNQTQAYTLFVPTNIAFERIGMAASQNASTQQNNTQAPMKEIFSQNILPYHIAREQLSLSQLLQTKTIETYLQGFNMTVNVVQQPSGGQQCPQQGNQTALVDEALVTVPDMQAQNATIHGIDTVLNPCFVTDKLFAVQSGQNQ